MFQKLFPNRPARQNNRQNSGPNCWNREMSGKLRGTAYPQSEGPDAKLLVDCTVAPLADGAIVANY